MMTIFDLQQALAARGFDPGPVDGVNGPLTLRAVRAFQRSVGLDADGIVGPLTRGKLFPSFSPTAPGTAIPLDMPWLIEADRLRGLREGPGRADNPVILDWARALDVEGVFTGDDVAWCGLFTAHCVRSALPDEPLPGNLLGARAWGKFGLEVSPQWGAVMVFWRGSPDGWQGHVGFYWAEDATHFHILGGNQGDRVSIVRIERTRLITARWPRAASPKNIQRRASAGGILTSSNEA